MLAIQITTPGSLFGRAASLGDRRLLFRIVNLVKALDDRCLRSESQRLEAYSIGLRRSEIDGYIFAS